MKYIKTLLAITTIALLGSSAWADQNVEVEVGKTITITSQSQVSRNYQWKVDWNNDQSRSEIKNPSDNGFTIDGNYQDKGSTAGTVSFTVTGNSPTAANNPVVLRLKQKSTKSGSQSEVLEKINVTVVAPAPIAKTVEVGKTINFNSTAKITASYYYQFIIDGSSTAVTRTPTSVKQNGGSAANVALSLTGQSVTASPVTVRLQQSSRNDWRASWSDVETYSVTVTDPTKKSIKLSVAEIETFTFPTDGKTGWDATMTSSSYISLEKKTENSTFIVKIGSKQGKGAETDRTATVTVKNNSGTVLTIYVTALKDSDWGESQTSPKPDQKPLTVYVGDFLTREYNYVATNPDRAFAYDVEDNGTTIQLASSPVCNTDYDTQSPPADWMLNKNTIKRTNSQKLGAFTVTVTGKDVGTEEFHVYYGGGSPARWSGNYMVEVRDVLTGTPTASGIEYGQTLSASTISGMPKDSNDNTVSGTWAWVNPSLVPEAGTKSYPAKFTATGPNAQYYDVYECEISVMVTNPLTPVAVPTAVPGLVYDYTEKTGVVAQPGYTLTGNTATNAGNYTATAKLDAGYCWADDSSTTNKFIAWEIGYKSATVTAVETNKLVGTADPVFTTKAEGFIANDPSVLEWIVWADRTNHEEAVGFYDLIAYGDEYQGSYKITYEDLVNGFEIRAGKMTVNGKGYDNITDAFNDLLQNKGSATFNDTGIVYDGMTFQRGATLTVADDESWTVTNNGGTSLIATKIPGKMNLTVDGTLELSGDIFVGDRADVTTEVLATNVILAANVTVGAATEGFEPAGIATLAFDEIKVGDYKLTLTTNGVVQSATKLTIEDVFEEVEHFHVAEKAITGGFEYTLEATEFYVKYYDGDEVVHSNKFTILNYMTDLHIWNGDRKGLVLLGYTREDKVTPLAVTDEALRAYVKDEADKPGCDGEVKVLGTWVKPTITIKIVTGEGVDDVQTNGVSVVGDLELPADATEVKLELVKDDLLTIPVFKVITNDVTNVTQRVATYAVVEGLTYTFIAEEAEDDDPTVTPTDTKQAIIDAIDEVNREVVAPKIDAVVDTAEPPAAGKVSAKDMATWITENEIKSVDMKDSNYLAASVNLDTSVPITDAAEVKFVEVEEDTSTGFTFDFELKLSGKETPEELEVEAKKLAGYIQTTGDLGTDFEVIGDTKRVTIDPDTGKVTITPDPTKSAEFFKIVIPKDPGMK